MNGTPPAVVGQLRSARPRTAVECVYCGASLPASARRPLCNGCAAAGYVLPHDKAVAQATKESVPGAVHFLNQFTARYGQPDIGRHRAVYDLGNGFVMKVPYTWDGVTYNYREADWDETSTGIPLARCTVDDTNTFGLPLVTMEKVKPVMSGFSSLPDWAGFVDCQQVGHTADGRLVAYDL